MTVRKSAGRKEKAKRTGWLGRIAVRSDCCGTEQVRKVRAGQEGFDFYFG